MKALRRLSIFTAIVTSFLFHSFILSNQQGGTAVSEYDDVGQSSLLNQNYTVHASIPLQVVTDPSENTIHRFFHSSPFSPSNKFIVVVSMPSPLNFRNELSPANAAAVKVVDLQTGNSTLIDQTHCWDSQVGAHAQWGSSDEEVLYNTLQSENLHGDDKVTKTAVSSNTLNSDTTLLSQSHQQINCQSDEGNSYCARGVVYNMNTHTSRYLNCPIYHVRYDGKFSAAPNLHKIQYEQKGYGIRTYSGCSRNRRATKKDGLFINDIGSGQCILLVTLRELAQFAGFDLHVTPTYGFHTKWSSDGKYIMFVIRTLEVLATRGDMALTMMGSNLVSSVRVQHLFVIDFLKALNTKSGEHDPSMRGIKHIISWATKPFRRRDCRIHSPEEAFRVFRSNGAVSNLNTHRGVVSSGANENGSNERHRSAENSPCKIIHLRDGNHPNWVADTHQISMNLQSEAPLLQDYFPYPFSRSKSSDGKKIRSKWSIVTFDVDSLPEGFSFGQDGHIRMEKYTPEATKSLNSVSINRSSVALLPAFEANSVGTGHPNFLLGGRYILVDSYAKELSQLKTHLPQFHIRDALSAPLRLIDALTQKEWWPLQMQILRTPTSSDNMLESTGLLNDFGHFWRDMMNSNAAALKDHNHDSEYQIDSEKHHRHLKARRRSSMRMKEIYETKSQQQGVKLNDEDASWRCDMHPAFSQDYQLVALNGRPQGMERQVVVFKVQDMMKALNLHQ